MKNNQKRFQFSKKNIFLGLLGAILVLLLGWWAYTTFVPRPLGDGLEYLGKRDYGSYFFADAKPYSKYYYGTDMSIEEIKKYFPRAQLQSSDSYANSGDYRTQFLDFMISDRTFTISYYNDAPTVTEILNIKKTNKKYLISIPDYDYEVAKKAL